MCTIVFERKEKNNIAVKHTYKYALDQKKYTVSLMVVYNVCWLYPIQLWTYVISLMYLTFDLDVYFM